MVAAQPEPLTGTRPDLEGQVALVTGGARAIGREIAETLARRGAAVASLDLSESDETVATIRDAGGEALGLVGDVTDPDQVAAGFARTLEHFGRLDILVNNAGLFSTVERRPFWEIEPDEWDLLMRANVKSVFLCSRAAAGPMREARRGRIVNLASNVVSFGMANFLHYVASKGAVIAMTRSLARELGPFGVAVNAVSPGLVTTEVTRETVPEAYRRQVAEGQCLTEPLVPPDIAEAVAYLAGSGARLVTGQTLLVNGGASMGPA